MPVFPAGRLFWSGLHSFDTPRSAEYRNVNPAVAVLLPFSRSVGLETFTVSLTVMLLTLAICRSITQSAPAASKPPALQVTVLFSVDTLSAGTGTQIPKAIGVCTIPMTLNCPLLDRLSTTCTAAAGLGPKL